MAAEGTKEINSATFCEEVQKYECLYNKFNKEYKNKFVKLNCWKTIAKKFDISPEAAEKRFKNARTAYGRYLRKLKNVASGSGREAVPSLPREFANLEWLQPHMTSRKTSSNYALNTNDDAESAGVQSANESEGRNEDAADAEADALPLDIGDESYNSSAEIGLEQELDAINDEQVVQPRGAKKAPSKGHPWSSHSKKCEKKGDDSFELALLKSASNIAEHVKNASESKKRKAEEPIDCDDTLYCKSLIGRFKALDKRSKAYMRLQIEQLFFQIEDNFGGGNGPRHFSTPQSSQQQPGDIIYQGHNSYLPL